jgi:hypothetical protein
MSRFGWCGGTPKGDSIAVEWFKSSFSNGSQTCVEVRLDEDHVSVRDSKDPAGPILTFTRGEWTAFLHSAAAGEFDI